MRGVVSSIGPGRLAQVQVDALQRVTAGQVLARVITVEPRILEAQISLSKARIGLIRAGTDSDLRKQNSRVNLESLRLDWMSKRVDWLSAKARSAYRQLELARLEKLRAGVANGGPASAFPVLSQDELDISRRDAAIEEAAVVELEQLVAQIGTSIQQLSASRPEGPESSAISAAVEVESKNLDLLESQMMPVDLLAPFDGVVSVVHRWSGETIQAGEPILTVSQEKPSRVVAFIRQPIQVQAQAGMKVEVRARGENVRWGLVKCCGSDPNWNPLRRRSCREPQACPPTVVRGVSRSRTAFQCWFLYPPTSGFTQERSSICGS